MGFPCGFGNVSPDKQAINKSIMLSSAKALITRVVRKVTCNLPDRDMH